MAGRVSRAGHRHRATREVEGRRAGPRLGVLDAGMPHRAGAHDAQRPRGDARPPGADRDVDGGGLLATLAAGQGDLVGVHEHRDAVLLVQAVQPPGVVDVGVGEQDRPDVAGPVPDRGETGLEPAGVAGVARVDQGQVAAVLDEEGADVPARPEGAALTLADAGDPRRQLHAAILTP